MTDAPNDDEIKISKAQLAAAVSDFHRLYGAALAEWSRLEGQLFYWFQILTGMDEKTARGVFFSARNFNARADMLEAALDAENPTGPIQDFLEAVLKKARSYSGFRNAATHGEPHINLQRGSATAGQMVIIQGRKVSHEAEATMITVDQLEAAQQKFQALAGYIHATLPHGGHPQQASLIEMCRQLVLALPNQAHSTPPDRKPSEPKPPPKA